MADPVGVTASILTLLGAAAQLGKLINSIHNAPVELLALSNEVNDLCIVYRELEKVHETWPDTSVNLSQALHTANEKIATLQQLVDDSASKGLSAIGRVNWVLRKKGKMQKTQRELREVRRQLDTLIATNSLSGNCRIELALEHLSLQNNHSFYESQARISRQLEDLNSTVQSLTLLSSTPAESNSQMQLSTVLPTARSNYGGAVAISMRESPFSCPIWCSCKCHARQNINLFNVLFIGYTASPFRSRKCSERSCKSGPSSFRARITFYFPRFLLSKALAIHIGINQYKEPSFSLTVRNVLPNGASIFSAARTGNVQRLKHLLGSHKAHPNDIEAIYGMTALHVAIGYKQFDAVTLLINAGSNPNIEDYAQMTAFDYAWAESMCSSTDIRSIGECAQQIFPAYDVREAWMLTILHKTVLGFIERDLKVELSISTAEIDTQDIHGRTPLWWACKRGDVNAVRQLLQFGADPNIAHNDGYTPFLNAVRRGDLELCFLLIESCSDMLHVSRNGTNALHLSVYFRSADLGTFMQRILDASGHGLINAQSVEGMTPLARAAWYGNAVWARLLLASGADVEIRDAFAFTPLLRSLYQSNNEVALLLLEHGANYLIRDNDDLTILHHAAWSGDVETLEILANFNLEGLDPEATDEHGDTATDFLDYREYIPEGFVEAFHRLLDKLRRQNDSGASHATDFDAETSGEENELTDSSDEEEEFEDALEEH